MDDNVRLVHTPYGAETVVNIGAFQVRKSYPTMRAAAAEARQLRLIDARQQVLLEDSTMARPVAFTSAAEAVDSDSLFDCGFKLR